jgi:Tfp pilus assembly protein PilO
MGALAKITQMQVYIIAAVLVALVGAGIWFGLIKPQQEALEAAQARYDAANAIAITRPQAEADQKKANQEVAVAKAKWNRFDSTLMPNINISNFLTGSQQLWNEQVLVLGPKVRRYLEADNKVRVLQSNITIPAPSTDPNQVNKKSFEIPMGSIAVQGTFQNVLNHVVRWNRFDRLVLVDGLSLTGNSPRLTGTYNMRVIIFTRGEASTETIPQATTGTGDFGGGFAGPGGPGGPGGYPGAEGYPGAPEGAGGPEGAPL